MPDSRLLLKRITELRERLEKGRAATATAVAEAATDEVRAHDRWEALKKRVRRDVAESTFMAQSVEQITGGTVPTKAVGSGSVQLTSRARGLLERGRELLGRLRVLGGRIEAQSESGGEEAELLSGLYRETAAMLHAWLRLARHFPSTAIEQFRLCDGMEPAIGTVEQRVRGIESAIERREHEQAQVKELAAILLALDTEPNMERVTALADRILDEAGAGVPLRILSAAPQNPPEFVACHSLNVARVMARVLKHQPGMRERRLVAIIAALIHDAGMLSVPVEILAQAGPLTDEQKRVVESHCRRSAELAEKLLPSGTWLQTAVAGHHERLDGTGYPAGLRGERIDALTRLLIVCDVYAAMCAPRPYRDAREPRAALADVLVLAEQGIVDQHQAECLLHLGFYPVGTVVELADGSVGRVAAVHPIATNAQAAARPVVAVLTDADRHLLPVPRFVDLLQSEGSSIVRSLSPSERIECIGQRYPEWV